ncbi:MAG: undecaprenyldiphospho-muramoylpentapeptide beta-N-acetylglucosaminyltransferase [Patescibacteria group bacterium]
MKIIFSGGGTLGSVTPLMAVAEAVKKNDSTASFLWIGTKDGPERQLIQAAGLDFVAITSGRWRRFLTWQNFVTPFLVLKGLIDAWRLLRRFEPDVVMSAGGFVAVPVVWAAWWLRIPVHVHQLDWRPGLANRLSSGVAKTISVTFDKSRRDFDQNKVTVTGNPVRNFLLTGQADRARIKFGLQADLPLVLVLGGGTGAMNLNRLVAATVADLSAVQVLHLTGRDKRVAVPTAPSTYQQIEFLTDELADVYAAADLVVTRAGMGTLTELAALGIPAVIVPIPNSHQEENADYFVEQGAAVRFDENKSGAELAQVIRLLIAEPSVLPRMSAAMQRINSVDAAQKIVEILLGH